MTTRGTLRRPTHAERPLQDAAQEVQGAVQVAQVGRSQQPQIQLEREVSHMEREKVRQELAIGEQSCWRKPQPEAGRNETKLRIGAMHVDAQSQLLPNRAGIGIEWNEDAVERFAA